MELILFSSNTMQLFSEHDLDRKMKLFCIKTRFTRVTLKIGMFVETSNGEHNAFINLNRNYMYKDTSYLGGKLPQVTFSKRNKHCSLRLMEQ